MHRDISGAHGYSIRRIAGHGMSARPSVRCYLVCYMLLLMVWAGRRSRRGTAASRPKVPGTAAPSPPCRRSSSPAPHPRRRRTGRAGRDLHAGLPRPVVTLERRTRTGWRTVATAVEDAWGSASFAPGPGTYRAAPRPAAATWITGSVTTSRWEPSFEDTFSGTTLDTSVWNDQEREHESVYAPRTCARVDPAARRVGQRRPAPRRRPRPGAGRAPPAPTRPHARVRQPAPTCSTARWRPSTPASSSTASSPPASSRSAPKGMHSGFWMLPGGTTYADGQPAAGTEIDVMEFFGENGRGTRDHRLAHPLLPARLEQGQPR